MTLKTQYEYIQFVRLPSPGKTSVWSCINTRDKEDTSSPDSTEIGTVKWYGSWRRYCFFAAPNTIFSAGCNRDIADFIDQLMAERRGVPR